MPKTPFHISKYISTTVFLVAENIPLHQFSKNPLLLGSKIRSLLYFGGKIITVTIIIIKILGLDLDDFLRINS